MNTAWEVVLQAKEQGIDPQILKFSPNCNSGPYRETGFTDLNIQELGETAVEINPLYRFTHIFAELLDVNLEELPKARELLFDVFLHYQTQLDLRSGLTKSEYYIRAVLKDLLAGIYGEAVAKAIRLLIYIPMLKRETEQSKLHFLVSMFLEINYTVYSFWGHHFGIIGLDETLEYDKMVLF